MRVPASALLPFLKNGVPAIRGAAALALSRHQLEIASKAVPELLKKEEEGVAQNYALYVRRGKPKLTQQEIDPIIEDYREQMKLIQRAGAALRERCDTTACGAGAFVP